jgi:hypothetical protein
MQLASWGAPGTVQRRPGPRAAALASGSVPYSGRRALRATGSDSHPAPPPAILEVQTDLGSEPMPDKAWEQMSTDEKLEQLHRQHGQEIADLRYKLGRLETEIQRLRQTLQRAKP